MAEIHSLDALDPVPVNVKDVTEALLKVSRDIRARWVKFSEDTEPPERYVNRALISLP